jgi:excisionase family DNA binding protein
MEGAILLKVRDVLTMLGIGRTKLNELIQSGELRVVHIGRSVRIRRTDLIDWIDKISTAETNARGR